MGSRRQTASSSTKGWVSLPRLITQELEDSIWKPNGRARRRSPVEGLMEQEFTTGSDDAFETHRR